MGNDSEKKPTFVGIFKYTGEALCGNCDKVVELEDTEFSEMDDGREKIEGNCPDCGSKITVYVSLETE